MNILDKIDSYLLKESEWYDNVQKVDDATSALMDIFGSDKVIKDHRDFHELAESLDMESDELEERAYKLIQSFFSQGRYNKEGSDLEFDPEELAMGDKVELEHTSNPLIARRIALDHLTELPDYYSRLKVMEDEGKAAMNEASVQGNEAKSNKPTDAKKPMDPKARQVAQMEKKIETLQKTLDSTPTGNKERIEQLRAQISKAHDRILTLRGK